jgi:hypothetical protein
MARVDWAIPCRYAEENGGLATIVGAGIDRLYVSELPGEVGVLIALRIVLREDELGHEHEIAFTLYDPTMAVVAHLEGHFSAEAHPAKEPGWETGMIAPTAQLRSDRLRHVQPRGVDRRTLREDDPAPDPRAEGDSAT